MSSASPPDAPWVAIPVKPFAVAKGRLSGALDERRRPAFARAMLGDVLDAATRAKGIGGVLVISRDPIVRAMAGACGADAIAEPAPGSLDGAVAAAARWLERRGTRAVIVLPADVPLVTPAEIESLADAVARSGMAIQPARDGDGTNALALSPPSAIAPAFGKGSFRRHKAAARAHGIAVCTLDLAGLALDIDRAADLALFAAEPSPTRAWRYLESEGLTPPPAIDVERLLTADLADLMSAAASVRDKAFGPVVTYSRKVFIPLTKLCRDVCAYCTFAETPNANKPAYMSVAEAVAVARAGAAAGCKEALFTLGDQPELRYRQAREELDRMGFATTLDYLAHVARAVYAETGLLPHVNPGVMGRADIEVLRKVSVSQGLMLESASGRLCEKGGPHFGSPDKAPAARLETIRLAGEARVPFTTGILIGIGETRRERIESLLALHDLHDRYGHIQEIIVQNFRAKADTRMAAAAEPDLDDHLWTVAVARLIFGGRLSIQAPPNLQPGALDRLIAAGIDDWGGVSPVTPDHVNPEAPWPHLDTLAKRTAEAGKILTERLAIYPAFARDPAKWLAPELRTAVARMTDAEGFPRTDNWLAGLGAPPPDLSAAPAVPPADDLTHVLHRARDGRDLAEAEIVRLFAARGSEVGAVMAAANDLRREINGDAVTYVVNRNVNYTNVCGYRCGFCAFSKGKLAANLRGRPYVLDRAEIGRRAAEAFARGATEACLQGGIHPEYTGDTYIEIAETVKAAEPSLHVHAFSPLEVTQGAATLGLSLETFLRRLKDAGLGSLPGTAAEILDDEVRRILCPDKITTGEWLAVMEAAHGVGLRTTSTIMYGHVERPVHWARHLLRLRALQARTGGFTEFVPLPFVAAEAPIYLKGIARKGPTFREAILMHAVARLALHPHIQNIQASWVKLGPDGVAVALKAGANDLGGTLMNESITRAAGAVHGQEMAPERIETIIRATGRVPRQRTTLYGEPSAERVTASFGAAPLSPAVDTPAKKYERRAAAAE